ncbi:MAG TPA: hypothetical protein VE401_03215 [Solirubrobacterales bacterium]|nr:hypothetical protein [Solirubrobacterales bacterium]
MSPQPTTPTRWSGRAGHWNPHPLEAEASEFALPLPAEVLPKPLVGSR